MSNATVRSLFLLAALLSLAACSTIGLGSNNNLQSIRIESTADGNRNMPVAVDFLFIRDAQLARLLADLSGPDWFVRKKSLVIRYDMQMDLVSAEVVPLSVMPSVSLPDDSDDAISILMFANYLGQEGQFVAQLGNFRQLSIRLERERYRLSELDEH